MASSAILHVLDIPELLDHIFSYLDKKTLLVTCQRVSRGFKDTITASPTIQKRLLFRTSKRAKCSNAGQGQGCKPGDGRLDLEINDLILQRTLLRVPTALLSALKCFGWKDIGKLSRQWTNVGTASSWGWMHLTSFPNRKITAWVCGEEAVADLQRGGCRLIEKRSRLTLGDIVDGLERAQLFHYLESYRRPAIHIVFNDFKDSDGMHCIYRVRNCVYNPVASALYKPTPKRKKTRR